MRSKTLAMLAGAVMLTTSAAQAATTSFYYDSQSSYRSVADSPFAAHSGSSTFWLEDFEDELINTLGLTGTYGAGTMLGPSSSGTDSVDADGDGVIDGWGTGGHSLFIKKTDPVVTFTFDAGDLGQLPTFAGLAWTDGNPEDVLVFEAFDGNSQSLGTIQAALGDLQWMGETEEDRFLGVSHELGISAIKLYRVEGSKGFELDHVQYGYGELAQVVPVPPAAALGAAGIIGLVIRRRRKHA